MSKQRTHNEWFRTVSLGKRKSCPNCKQKLDKGESIWSWGNYISGKWHTVLHFCTECFVEKCKQELLKHRDECGCGIELVGYQGEELPEWLNLEGELVSAEDRLAVQLMELELNR
jgi:uncharacterized protein (DUF983 family)